MTYFVTDVPHQVIPEFPNYCVTIDGRIFNIKTGRDMRLSPTEMGDLTIGMMRDGVQHRRSVKVLVAEAFVPDRTNEFNTPIQLDGNKDNLRADNILWRPRWFAWRYSSQFTGNFPEWYFDGPILDIRHDVEYLTIIGASSTQGILCDDILESIRTNRVVFPTGQIFIRPKNIRFRTNYIPYNEEKTPFFFLSGGEIDAMNESRYQSNLMRKIQNLIPGTIVLRNDPKQVQGIPDIIVLYGDKWAMLEVKESGKAPIQPNQQYYIDRFREMSFASFIHPDNEEEVLGELQRSFRTPREARISES